MIFLLLVIVLLAGGIGAGAFNQWKVDMTLHGSSQMTVEVDSIYHESGAQAAGYGSVLSFVHDDNLPVTVKGRVDTHHLGTYTILYDADFHGTSAELSRVVKVVDTQAPLIRLKFTAGHYTQIGAEYEEEGYTATDNVDGDITGKVERVEKDGKICYSVADSSGNTYSIERQIFYDDRIDPVLTIGEEEVTLEAGETFTDSYTASDDVDGDLTEKVVVDGTVDTSVPGIYTLNYTVSDAHGNTVKAQRKVTVKAKRRPQLPPDESGHVAYLTFDDGPGQYTQRLLDILARYGVHATFFVTNQFPSYQDMIGKEAAAGHAIGVHSYSHVYSQIYTSPEAYWADFEKMEEIIVAQTGSRTNLLRFPGGSSNTVSRGYCTGVMSALVDQTEELGYTYFDWNVVSGDAGETQNSAQITENIIDGIASHRVSVILCHDIHSFTIDAIEDVLIWGQENGVTFAALTEGSYTAHHGTKN